MMLQASVEHQAVTNARLTHRVDELERLSDSRDARPYVSSPQFEAFRSSFTDTWIAVASVFLETFRERDGSHGPRSVLRGVLVSPVSLTDQKQRSDMSPTLLPFLGKQKFPRLRLYHDMNELINRPLRCGD